MALLQIHIPVLIPMIRMEWWRWWWVVGVLSEVFQQMYPWDSWVRQTSAALSSNNNSSHSLWSWRRSRLRFELNMNVKLFYLVIKRSQSSTFFGIIIKTFIISTLLMWGIDRLYHLPFIWIQFHKFVYLHLYKMINGSNLVRGVKLEVLYPWFTSINWLKSDSIQ